MISLTKLKENLKQSQQWNSTFKAQIQQQMQQISLKNQEISTLSKSNAELTIKIDKMKTQLKVLSDKQIKDKYKTDRQLIRVEEIANRVQLYEDIYMKKKKWNEELLGKVEALRYDIEKEMHNPQIIQFDQESMFNEGNNSQTKRSGNSQMSFRQTPIKAVSIRCKDNLETKRQRIKKLQRQKQLNKRQLRSLEEQLQQAHRKGQKLSQLLNFIQKEEFQQNKENDPLQRQNSETNDEKARKNEKDPYNQLFKQSQRLSQDISEKYSHIQKLSQTLKIIVSQDNDSLVIHQQVNNLEREVRKQKMTANTLRTYILEVSRLDQ